MEAGKKRRAGDTLREANTDEVKGLCKETRNLTEVVAERRWNFDFSKKHDRGWGDDE